MSIYQYKLGTPQGDDLDLSQYEGKVVLVVNTATQCGLAPQFDGLEKLHQTYKDKGLVVLGTPCNQFSNQEPVANAEMTETCRVNHGVSFQLSEKIAVNGPQTHPLYRYLKSQLGGLLGSKIKWNFTKFLIDKNGKPFKRYAPVTKPAKLEADIKGLLS